MKILLLCHGFNSLTQRLYTELARLGHELSVEFDINDETTIEAVDLFQPDLIVAPYLKRAIPEPVWFNRVCLVVHPGIVGDRGPSALDWAVLNAECDWGVTVLQANAEMDAGDIWAAETFPMRPAAKASLYRREVTDAAWRALETALNRFQAEGFRPRPLDYGSPDVRGRLRPPVRQEDRAIDWAADDTRAVLRKIRSADGFPGVSDRIAGLRCRLFDAHAEDRLRGAPGDLLAWRDGAVCRATTDGAVWIGHLRALEGDAPHPFKLPATQVLAERVLGLPEDRLGFEEDGRASYREIGYTLDQGIGCLRFDFYNGAMSTEQCRRLLAAYRELRAWGPRVIVLLGGEEFFSNGIHLNRIEAADSPADESWRNINAMDDLVRELLTTEEAVTVAALRGNAGAGGAFLAMAADRVIAHRGVVLNPHYKNMGNLHGSEYWTYVLPRRVGRDNVQRVMGRRLPLGVPEAVELGLVDECHDVRGPAFSQLVMERARRMADDPGLGERLRLKAARLADLEQALDAYRDQELEHMRLNFYGFDPSYHVARYNFVYKRPHSWTPLHLAVHR